MENNNNNNNYNAELKEEYTYDDIKNMLGMIVGWFTATKEKGFTEEDIEKHREYTAQCCKELALEIQGGCTPYNWEEDEEDINELY